MHNLSYILFGYYFVTLLSYQQNLTVEEQSMIIILFGSFLGTFIYYVKPIERIISFYLRRGKNNKIDYDENPDYTFYVYKTQVLYSPYLQDERVIINGAFFLGLGLLISNGVLSKYSLGNLYLVSVAFAITLFTVGLLEIHDLLDRKLGTLMFFYGFYNRSKRIEELRASLNAKDWIQADRIVADQSYLFDYKDNYDKPISYCPKCLKRVTDDAGKYCINCGSILTTTCPSCKNSLYSQQEGIPRYCPHCGVDLTKPSEASK
jgi:hypothetical protein